MKILITYYSNTGNTETIAKSMKEGLEGHDTELLKLKEKDNDPSILKNYDIVFLGSGIYGGKIKKPAIDLIKMAETLPPKFVLFCTHASADSYQHGFKIVKKKIEAAKSKVLGEWDCMGENIGIPIETQKMMMSKLPPEKQKEAQEHMELLKGHPDAEDLNNAKEFAKSIIN